MDTTLVKRMSNWLSDIEILELAKTIREFKDKTPDDVLIEQCLEGEVAKIRAWIHENGLDLDDVED